MAQPLHSSLHPQYLATCTEQPKKCKNMIWLFGARDGEG